MNSPVDKEYLESRLETIRAQFSGEMKDYHAQFDVYRAENEAAHLRLEAKIDLAREETSNKIAQAETRVIKWVVGAMLAQTTILVSIITVMLHAILTKL